MATDLKTPARPSASDARHDEPLKGGEPIPPTHADAHTSDDTAVESPVEARQGFLGRPVLLVLVGGLVLALVAWIVVAKLTY